MNRGDHQEPIFADDADRQTFLRTLAEACSKTAWQVHAWCLMSNHFHLVVETPQPNLVAGMKWLLGTYTGRFNRRHRKFGYLFAGRYKSLVVDGSGNGYLRTVAEYVHLNPVRAKLVRAEQALRRYRWSSYPVYLLPRRRRPGWLRVDRVLGELPGRRWRGKVLDRLPKSDPGKVALALRLRAETTLSVAWIAGRLRLGTRQYATKLLYGARRQSGGVKS